MGNAIGFEFFDLVGGWPADYVEMKISAFYGFYKVVEILMLARTHHEDTRRTIYPILWRWHKYRLHGIMYDPDATLGKMEISDELLLRKVGHYRYYIDKLQRQREPDGTVYELV